MRKLVFAIVVMVVWMSLAQAQIPRLISYQGVLTDTLGVPRPDGTYSFTFRLFDAGSGGVALWTEQKTLAVQRGHFVTILGDQVVIGPALKFDRRYWLGIQVAADPELAPRIPLTSNGYSFSAIRSDTALVALTALSDTLWRRTADTSITRARGRVGIGTTSPDGLLTVNGSDWGNFPMVVRGLPNDNGATLDMDASNSTGGHRYSIMSTGPTADPGAGYFGAFDNTAGAWRFVVGPTGNFGIGTTSPGTRLDVVSGGIAALFRKGSTSATSTFAATQMENFSTIGESAWMRNSSSSNISPVLKLNRHPSSTGSFIDGINWDGVNAAARVFHITGAGTYVAGSDFAETFAVEDEQCEPGDVVVLAGTGGRVIRKSRKPNDPRLVGVYSTRPGILGADKGGETRIDPGEIPVAITGIVPVRVTTENGPIAPGDLLTTSSTPGYAMKAIGIVASGVIVHPTGTILGKALHGLEDGQGVIDILLIQR